MKRQAIVAANWKMNGSLGLVEEISTTLNKQTYADGVTVVVCPPFPYLSAMQTSIEHNHVQLGVQNMSDQESGAYTGEVSATILQEFSVQYVIIGHSERRSLYAEDSQLVANKVKVALEAGLTPILCIGESEQERESEQTEQVLSEQLTPVVELLGNEKFAKLVVAYEPVWAIGTGKTASPEMAQETHKFIREFLAKYDAPMAEQVPLLYGGSVNASNCENLFAQPDIDGGLIGGASLKADQFSVICAAAKGTM